MTTAGTHIYLRQREAYIIFNDFKVIIHINHRPIDGAQSADNIVEDNRLPLQPLASTEALAVNQSHLLDNCRFSRLSSS